MTPNTLTPMQKVHALSMHAMGAKWFLKVNDFFTSALGELDLQRITAIGDGTITVENCAKPGELQVIPLREFTGNRQGALRVWVPNALLEYIV